MLGLPIKVAERAKAAAAKIDGDVYLFNGALEFPRDLECIEAIHRNVSRK